VIDVAGNQHHGLKSHVEIWSERAGLFLTSIESPSWTALTVYAHFCVYLSRVSKNIFLPSLRRHPCRVRQVQVSGSERE